MYAIRRGNLFSAFAFICLLTVTGVWIQFLNVHNREAASAPRITYRDQNYVTKIVQNVSGLEYLTGNWRQRANVFPTSNLSTRVLTIGIPTIKRENKTYIFETLDSLFNCSTEKERENIYIVILLADFNKEWRDDMIIMLKQKYPGPVQTGLIQVIEAPTQFYPPFTNLHHTYAFHSKEKRKWRAKQNFDYAFLFMYSKPLSIYYMQLEDDVYTIPGYISRIQNHLLFHRDWVCLEFSELGYIGKTYHSSDLEKLAKMILLFYVEQPGDFTYLHFNTLMLQFHRIIVQPTLFQHAGLQSSLRGKIQDLKDNLFASEPKLFHGDNPPAKMLTTIPNLNPRNPLFTAYDMANGIFWTKCAPRINDTITIVFDTPQPIDQVIIDTGTINKTKDILSNGRLDAGFSVVKNHTSSKCSQDVFLGTFKDGKINATNVAVKLGCNKLVVLPVLISDMLMEQLQEAIAVYFKLGLSQRDIVRCLAHINSVIISERTLRRHLKSLGLFRRKQKSDVLDVALYLIHQIEVLGNQHGYRFHYLNCVQNGYTVTQDTIRQLLHVIDADGIRLRQRHRLQRRRYHNPGPNFMWHIDSYDKLKPYGICINGAIDGFSRYVIWSEVYKTSSDPKLIGGYFANAVKSLNGCPTRVRADAGTENGTVKLIQVYLREDHVDAFADSPYLCGSSNHNQRIESWWCFLRKHKSQQWMNTFQTLKDEDFFDGNFLDKNLVQFCFIDMIQDEVNHLVHLWNSHNIRPCRNSVAPSGKPMVMFCLPHLYGVRNELCAVESQKLDACAEECSYKTLVCDPTVYELCRMLMAEESLSMPKLPEEGIALYKKLRTIIQENL